MAKKKQPDADSPKAEEARPTRYDEHWIRYIVCAGVPVGAFIFLTFARHYSEQLALTEQNLTLDSITCPG